MVQAVGGAVPVAAQPVARHHEGGPTSTAFDEFPD
jgi:hypothetical protein